jgi:hypothetical protein
MLDLIKTFWIVLPGQVGEFPNLCRLLACGAVLAMQATGWSTGFLGGRIS